MDRAVTFREFQEMKEWMVATFATKEDLKQFATKEDLREAISRLQTWVIQHFVTKQYLEDLKNWCAERFATRDEMLTGFDKILGKLEGLEQEQVFTRRALERIEARLGI